MCHHHAKSNLDDSWDKQLRMQLHQELRAIEMKENEKDEVMKQLNRRRNEKTSFWNREITISVPLAALALMIVIGMSGLSLLQSKVDAPLLEQMVTKKDLVNLESGVFYESDLHRLLK